MQRFLLFFIACLLACTPLKKIHWSKVGNRTAINAAGIKIATPPGQGWEFAAEYNGQQIKRINFRNIDQSNTYSATGHIRAVGTANKIKNSAQLAQLMQNYIRKGRTFTGGQLNTNIGQGCKYNCASYNFNAVKAGSRKFPNTTFNFLVSGYFFQHPTNNAIFEVMLSERFPIGQKSRLNKQAVDQFFKSLRFNY